MDTLENFIYLVVTTFNFMLVVTWLVLVFVALVKLRATNLSPTPKAVWAALICALPILGALAFFVVRPEDSPSNPS